MVKNFELKVVKRDAFLLGSEMVSLSGRKLEFKEAAERADKSELYVFCDSPDRFGVVNGETKQHYRVNLKTIEANIYADCECPDFTYRKRVCKHIAAVISEVLFG
jgi:hypothetical protein